jgi:cupin 2 domain-containing protein
MSDPANLFVESLGALPQELVTTLVKSAAVRIERIISTGHCSPRGFWYDQDEHEWVLVLRGAATLSFEDDQRPIDLRPGDYVNIPAHRRHRVDWTSAAEPTVWLAVFYR